jgi:TM2 domain-containing membrane protein YozV
MISVNKKYFILVIFLLSFNLFAQNSFEEQFSYAIKLYQEENYFDTITELKRLQFFDSDDQYSFKSNILIGECYKQGAKFSDAINYFVLAELNASKIDELYSAKEEIIRANILRRTTARALALLDSLENDKRFKNKIDKINYWRGWAYIFADDWEKAGDSFSKISTDHDLKTICDQTNDKMYSVGFAKGISFIVPGAGQFYTGEYFSGILSLGWNILWGYLTVTSFVDERVFDGLMTGSFLWMRFYNGNIQNAEKFAVEKNLKISYETLKYLQYEYSGLKP